MIRKLICLGVCLGPDLYCAQTDSLGTSAADSLNSYAMPPAFSATGADAESAMGQQDASSLLQSSRDVFTQFAGFQFGAANYHQRGSSGNMQTVMINGIAVNDALSGYSSWSSWGGLNDVTRYIETGIGTCSNRYAFSGADGFINIDSKASVLKKGTRISYSHANNLYSNRVMLTHSTGMLSNGWAFSFSASSRSGNQVYVPGTYFNGSSFYVAIDRRINYKHMLSFTGFAAPLEQGLSTYETKEAYALAGSTYYNSNWGYQNGKVRNSAVSRINKPMLQVSHTYKPNKDTRWITTLFYTFGNNNRSDLSWNNAPNPHPDYYKYLPGYAYDKGDIAGGDRISQQWLTDINTRQLNWDRLIALNRNNLYALPSQLGQGIVTSETRARYMTENNVSTISNTGISSVYNKRIGQLFLSAGGNANLYQNRNYRIMSDLLGASYWLNYDQFAENLGVDASYQQNDIEHPDQKIRVGDKFGYDYAINIQRAELWSQLEYSFKMFDLYAAASLAEQTVWREGFVANGKFPLTSKGLSKKLNSLSAGFKAGATWKINGRHFITINTSVMSKPPAAASIFISPTVRNDALSDIGNAFILSGDLNYLVKYPTLKLRITYYNTQMNNQFSVRTYWHDSYNTIVNLIMKGVNQNNQGLELGIEKTVFTAHTLQGALGVGQFIYTNRPLLDAWQNNNNAALYKNRVAFLENYRVGGSPQLAAGLGYKYTARKHWFAGAYFNYLAQAFVEPNPDRRTEEALSKYISNETAQYNSIIRQEQLPGCLLVNLNGGASWRISKKYMLSVNLSVSNALNNKKIIVSGYEQLRWNESNINRFANKYLYMPGATYMATASFNL